MILIPSSPQSARAPRSGRSLKIAAVLGGLFYLFIAFSVVMRVQNPLVPTYTSVVAITAFPICAFLAFRYPMIFPFALYAALLPFDALLQVSGGSTISRLVAFATAGALILHAVLLKRAFVPGRTWFFWLAVVVYLATSLLWTSDPKGGTEVTGTVLQLFLFMTVLAMYPATKSEFRIALGLIVVAGVASAGYAFRLYLSGAVTSDSGSRISLSSGNVMLDFNYYAASFIVPLALALFFTFYGKRRPVQIASAASALLMLIGVLVTSSRGAFVAAVAIIVYFAIRSRYRVQVFVFMAIAASGSLFFPSVYERFARDPSSHQGSASGRTFIWETGLHSIKDHWLFGNGVGSFENTYDKNLLDVFQAGFQGWSRPSHSLLVGDLTELGVVGLIIVLAAWYMSFRQLRAIPKTSEWFGARIAFEAAIVALFAMSLTIDPTYIKYVWLGHSLALMLVNQVVPRHLRLARDQRRRPVGRPVVRGFVPGRRARAD